MSAAMDLALMAMSLEEEDAPFDMPDLPQFKSSDSNSRSLIGRLLNPACQDMAKLILDMPRKWQKNNRVTGRALSKERFQFIFQHEYEMEEILSKGIHTFEEWPLAMERWVKNPPPDYLQYVDIWVQIKNIPVNHYTEKAIMALGDLIGKTIVVAFDPVKSQRQDYVRALIRFSTASPLKKSRIVNLPNGGGSAEIYYFYERVQKRCYHCQRMTHEKPSCPLLVRERQQEALKRRQGNAPSKLTKELIIKPNDPLFGVLEESQVGLHPVLGRPKIAPEVLEGMRQYLLLSEGEERKIREEKVRKSVLEVAKDPVTERIALRLEDPPIITRDLNRGKGLVFGYEDEDSSTAESGRKGTRKLLGDAIKAGGTSAMIVYEPVEITDQGMTKISPVIVPATGYPTGYKIGLSEATSSGKTKKRGKPRKRPYVKKRRLRKMVEGHDPVIGSSQSGSASESGSKKRVSGSESSEGRVNRRKPNEAVPKEGLSNSQ